MSLVTLLPLRTRALESRQRRVCDLVTSFVWGVGRDTGCLSTVCQNLELGCKDLQSEMWNRLWYLLAVVALCHRLAGFFSPALGTFSDRQSWSEACLPFTEMRCGNFTLLYRAESRASQIWQGRGRA